MRTTRTTIVTLATAALLAASCGQAPSVQVADHDAGLDAITESLSGSWAWEGRLVADFSDEYLAGLDQWDRESMRWLEGLATNHVEGAFAADGSWRTALVDGDRTWLDLRAGLAEVTDGDPLASEAAVYLRLDMPYLLARWGFWLGGGIDEARADLAAWLDGSPLLDVALAVFDGGWGGVAGHLDLEAFGLSAAEIEEADRELRELFAVADRATIRELLDEATTLRDFERLDDGGSVAVVDVHPRAAARAVHGLFDHALRWLTGPGGEQLPGTLEAAATVRFDEHGAITEVRADLFAVARQLAQHGVDGADELPLPNDDSALEIALAFSRHGQIDTILDVPDAVTVSWTELAEAFAHELDAHEQAEVEVELEAEAELEGRSVDVDEDTGRTSSWRAEEVPPAEAVHEQLHAAAAALERYRAEHGTFTRNALSPEFGFEARPGVLVAPVIVDDDYYCLEGHHEQLNQRPVAVLQQAANPRIEEGPATCEELAADRERH